MSFPSFKYQLPSNICLLYVTLQCFHYIFIQFYIETYTHIPITHNNWWEGDQTETSSPTAWNLRSGRPESSPWLCLRQKNSNHWVDNGLQVVSQPLWSITFITVYSKVQYFHFLNKLEHKLEKHSLRQRYFTSYSLFPSVKWANDDISKRYNY